MLQRLLVLLLLLGMTIACNLPLNLTATPTEEETLVASPSPLPQITSTPVPLSRSVLENLAYTLPGFVDREPFSFQLKDGVFQNGEDPVAIDFIMARLGDDIAYGDLNGDDLPDAAVILAVNYGGTGVFVWVVAVLNQNGKAEQAAAFLIDDRPVIEQLSIENGRILLEALVHGPADPGCCPNQPVRWALRLMPAGLNLVSASTRIGDLWREINLELPVEDSRVGERVEVRGGVPIMPFEATLNYRVYSENGVEYQNSYIMVNAPDYGYPGTFQKEIDLSSVPPGVIYLEVSEISMADGSVIALTIVRLIRE